MFAKSKKLMTKMDKSQKFTLLLRKISLWFITKLISLKWLMRNTNKCLEKKKILNQKIKLRSER